LLYCISFIGLEYVISRYFNNDVSGFTIQPLPSHVHTERDIECECDSSSDTQYSSSEDEGEQTPSVDEAIKSYKPVLNRPYVDSGKAKVVIIK
jgi:hypothetical protein